MSINDDVILMQSVKYSLFSDVILKMPFSEHDKQAACL